MIIRAGRNVYPHELEEVVGNIQGVRKGYAVAFACGDVRTGTERLIVMAETRLTDEGERERLRTRISEAALALLAMPPDEVALVPSHAVPKTSSGKIRRSAARTLYESGAIAEKRRALWWQIARIGLSGAAGRVRRAVKSTTELGYAVYWWALLAAFAALIWPLVVVLPLRRWRHALLGFSARALFWLIRIPLEVERESAIPDNGVILVANHSSYLDGLVLSAVIPGEVSFVVKEELRRQVVAGTLLKRLGAIFVRRIDPKGGVEDTEAMLGAVRSGARIISFPEGTLTRMPGLLAFRLGAFHVAAAAQVAVVPVTMRGTRTILRGDQWFPRRGRISVRIGHPLLPDGSDFAAAVRLRDKTRALMLKTSRQPDLARERVELPPD